MNPYNLKQDMILYCRDGQSVTLTAFNDGIITVQYKGKSYNRPLSAIGKTLFFENPCKQKMHATVVASVSKPQDPVTPHKEQPAPRSCMNCKFQKSGECTSWDLCDDYQPAYTVSKLETDHWPEYGDATMFKRKGRKH